MKIFSSSFHSKCLISLMLTMWTALSAQNYFQQTVNFNIEVTLNDSLHELDAFETIEYQNNSTDTLHFIYFHLWPNAYADNSSELAKQIFASKGKQKLFNDKELKGYIDGLDFRINNQEVKWQLLPKQSDICKIELNEPLLPGTSITISTPFHVKIPLGVTSRMGHTGRSYQISQWFPKPAVYDAQGWHPMSYLDRGEFYSEFGNFDVSITLPANYIVAATGELQTKHEIEMLDSLANDSSWRSISMLGKTKRIPPTSKTKVLHYKGTNMHDFAWFADQQFNVMKGKVVIPGSGKVVTTWVMFTNKETRRWRKALHYVNDALLYFSNAIGDYPYTNFTAVQSTLNAGLGMEYPGLAVIGRTKDAYALDEVISHEACHSWFYGALASNERRYPFMDESLTSNYEQRYMNEKYPKRKAWESIVKTRKQASFLHIENMSTEQMLELPWLTSARNNQEQAIDLSSTDFTESNYGIMIYNKASAAFTYLRKYLGDSIYDAAMQDYYQKWKFRHPQPENLRSVFDAHTEKDINWFFDDLLGTTKRLDYKIDDLKNNKLLVKNKAELISPLIIAGLKGDSICFEKWIDGFSGEQWIEIPEGDYTEIKIDPYHIMPELNRLNNNIKTSGIVRKRDDVETQLLFSIENPEKHSIMYIPAINWNRENGFMAGISINNGLIIPKPVEYLIMPFYAFSNATLSGYGKVAFNFIPFDQFFEKATITIDGTQFGAPGHQNYRKMSANLQLKIKPLTPTRPIRQMLYGKYSLASDLFKIINGSSASLNSYFQLGYQLQKIGYIHPYKINLSIESGKQYQKATAELKYKYSYSGKRNGLEMRLFGASMLSNKATVPFYGIAAGGRSGREQYLYEGLYPDRFGANTGSFWARQMTLSEGGLVSPVNEYLGYSKWLISLSLTSSLPGKISYSGIQPFINILINDHGLSAEYASPIFAEAGLKFNLLNIFEIYFPFVTSSNIQSIHPSLSDKIRIVLNLDVIGSLK